MANMIKVKDYKDIGHLGEHYKRGPDKGHYSNPDIDQERLDEDRTNFAPTRYKKDKDGNYILDDDGHRIEQKMTDYIKDTIKEVMGERTIRKDAVKMISWVVDAPRNMPDENKEQFFKDVYDFLTDRYGSKSGMGEDIVLSCYWHKSETTDHIHYAFMPIMKRPDGTRTFCAKECVGRDDLRTFHKDLEDYLVDVKHICKRGDILTGNTQRDSNGRALSIRELKARDHQRKRDDKSHSESASRWKQNNNRSRENARSESRWHS